MQRIVFRNVRVFDGSGTPPFDGHVVVEGERISHVAPGNPGRDLDALSSVDGLGGVLMPGLVDAHAHLGLGSTIHQFAKPMDRPDEDAALLMAHAGRVFLDSGFTSAYSGGSGSPRAEVAVQRAFAAGWVPGPRLRTSSFERVPGGPMGLRTRFPGASARAPAPEETVAFVHEMKAIGVESVKFLLNGVSAFDPGSNLGEQFHDSEIEAAAYVARELGLGLTAHCYTSHAIRLAVRTGFRVLYHCNYADEAALDAMESRKGEIFIGPAPGIVEADLLRGPQFGIMASPEQRSEQQQLLERIKVTGAALRQRGFKVLPGGDYGFPWNPIGRNAHDLTLFVDWFGYTPSEALRAATSLGGELMGSAHELGCIRPGYLADLLLVRGDPTQDIRVLEDATSLTAIMKGGRFHKAPLLGAGRA
jgi:imidazolonepropionase-like amidohydrolase